MLAPNIFRDIHQTFPRGAQWPGDAVRIVKRIVARLDSITGERERVALDECDDDSRAPRGVVVYCDGETVIVPLQFRRRVVLIDGEPVFVSHDDAVPLLAQKIADQVDFLLRQTRTGEAV